MSGADGEGARSAGEQLVRGEAWRDFCRRLEAVGERILADDFPSDPHGRAEGFRHLGRITTYALQWFLDFQDGEFPAFHRYDDDVVKWGGPNADNHYLRAKVDPRGSYRLSLDARGLRELILSTPEGEMQLDQYRVFAERSLADLEVGADGRLEVILSAEEHPGNWMPLHPETDHVLVRLYVSDWDRDAAPPVYIERIGKEGLAPARLEPATVATALDRAATWVERTVVYWMRFLTMRRAQAQDNVLSPPQTVPGGAADILYGAGWWKLAPDEVLLIECAAPAARYWSFLLYSAPWFESLDVANRSTSLSGEQMQIDEDGRFRLVVSAVDPAIPNWLDTEGRPDGLVSYRYVWSSDAPVPASRVVKVRSLREHLPAFTPSFDGAARRDQIVRRRRAIARRFRR
jgi:hypothetical protein